MSICFLQEESMIAGTRKILDFEYYSELNTGVIVSEIALASAKLVFCPYGEYSKLTFKKTAIITGGNTFRVYLQPEDTIGLSGVYTFQPIIIDDEGYRCRPTEGNIVIIPAIQ